MGGAGRSPEGQSRPAASARAEATLRGHHVLSEARMGFCRHPDYLMFWDLLLSSRIVL